MARPPPLKPTPAFNSPNVRLAMNDANGLTPRTPHSSRRTANDKARNGGQPQEDRSELDEIDLLASPDRQALLGTPRAGSSTSRYGRNSPVRTPGQPPLGSPWMDTIGSRMPATLALVFVFMIVGLAVVSIFAPGLPETTHTSDAAPLSETAPSRASPVTAVPISDADKEPWLSDVPPTSSTPRPHPHDPPARIIDYSKYKTFPLTPQQYAEECWVQFKHHSHGAFWDAPHDGIADVAKHVSDSDRKYCSASITYLLDGSSSGLVAELAIIAQVAQLAIDVGSK